MKKMLLTVHPTFFLLKSQCGDLEVVHLLLNDFVIRRKLIMVCIILFWFIWKMGHAHLIIVMLSFVTI
jgi:hypothetical protein